LGVKDKKRRKRDGNLAREGKNVGGKKYVFEKLPRPLKKRLRGGGVLLGGGGHVVSFMGKRRGGKNLRARLPRAFQKRPREVVEKRRGGGILFLPSGGRRREKQPVMEGKRFADKSDWAQPKRGGKEKRILFFWEGKTPDFGKGKEKGKEGLASVRGSNNCRGKKKKKGGKGRTPRVERRGGRRTSKPSIQKKDSCNDRK